MRRPRPNLPCLSLVVIVLGSGPARGATLCVNPGGTGGCFAAIQTAVDAAASGDVIQIDAGTYAENISIGGPGVLTLQGAGVGSTIIETGAAVPGVEVSGADQRVTLSSMSIRNGAQYGVHVDGARVTVREAEISGHELSGIFTAGRAVVLVDGSTLTGNGAVGPGYGSGIGIGAGGRLKVIRSTFSGNGYAVVAANTGKLAESGKIRIEDSTLSGNQVGAVFGRGRISRSTITQNVRGMGSFSSSMGHPAISASILSDNSLFSCGAGTRPRGYNYLATDCSSLATPRDIIGDDPMLGPLQDNGGPTMTHEPLAGSPVLEANPRGCSKPDQRGVDRLPSPCDIGAHEAP